MGWPREVEEVLSEGVSLQVLGVNNWALNREQALVALDKLEKTSLAVLGGDVYNLVDGLPEVSYDNWYCDRSAGESAGEYVQRSIRRARSYIYEYADSNALFALVVAE